MQRLSFTKMHASGNDFILMDNRAGGVKGDVSSFVRKLCRAHFSVGADGLILIEGSDKADFRWRYFNSDGGEVEMCGNGARCASRFAHMKGIAGRKLSFETLAGIIKSEITDTGVKVELTPPTDYRPEITVELDGRGWPASYINTGVPHVIYFVDDVDSVDVMGLGRATRYHKQFAPGGTNANRLEIRTYERGVEGETLACGTGATAAALVAGARGMAGSPVEMLTKGGNVLKIYFNWDSGSFTDVFLEGDAVLVYEGVLEEGALL
jgi:diaminopimelate epimerase